MTSGEDRKPHIDDIREAFLIAADLHGPDKVCQRKEALRIAHDIRKFEIERYWQRSIYFWGFQLTFFAAYWAILGTAISSQSDRVFLLLPILLAIAGLALCFAVLWEKLNDGAKTWQDNWERHVDMLEGEFTGHIYKTYIFMNTDVTDTKPPFSVSKINRKIIEIFRIFWVLIFVVTPIIGLSSSWPEELWQLPIFSDDAEPFRIIFLYLLIAALVASALLLLISNLKACDSLLRMSDHGTEVWPLNEDQTPGGLKSKRHVRIRTV